MNGIDHVVRDALAIKTAKPWPREVAIPEGPQKPKIKRGPRSPKASVKAREQVILAKFDSFPIGREFGVAEMYRDQNARGYIFTIVRDLVNQKCARQTVRAAGPRAAKFVKLADRPKGFAA